MRVEPCGVDGIHHLRHQLGPLQLPAVEVDADPHQWRGGVAHLPAPRVACGLLERPATELDDQAAAFRYRDEGRGCDQAKLRMIPSEERLRAVDRTGLEHHDGLVVKHELFLGQGAGHVGLQLQEVKRGAGKRGVELHIAGLASRFGDIHRDIGVADQFLRRLLARYQSGDPDAGVDGDLLTADAERGDELPGDPLRHPGSDLFILHVLEQHREFIAAEPSDGVAWSQRRADARPNRSQQLVADVVAQRVVNRLEVVEVEEEHRDPALTITVKRVIQVDPERGSVRQVRHRVVERLMRELVLECLALTDVARIEDQTADRRQGEQVGNGDLGGTVRVVLPSKPALERERQALDVDGLVDLAQHLHSVVVVDEVSERPPNQLGFGVAEDPLHRTTLITDQSVAIDLRDDIR